jgi:hypothetical protein
MVVVYIFVFINIYSCTSGNVNQNGLKPNSVGVEIETEEYKVYSIAIKILFTQDWKEPVVIVSETTLGNIAPRNDPEEVFSFLKENMDGLLSEEMIDLFRLRNKKPSLLTRNFSLGVEYNLVSADELRKVFQKGSWEEFQKQFQASQVLYLSRVAFGKDKSQCLVYVASVSGPKTAAGYYVLLVKDNEDWLIKKKAQFWVS